MPTVIRFTMSFHRTWKFGIVKGGKLVENDVILWIQRARIPIWFDFVYDEYTNWILECGDMYGCWPKPAEDYTFTVVRSTNSELGISMKNAAGLGWERKFCIAAGVNEDPETLGLRLWHEVLHAMSCDSDRLNPDVCPNDIDAFRNFVNSSELFKDDVAVASFLNKPYNHANNTVLRAYYYFLMVERLGCPALSIPPGPAVQKTLWQRLINLLKVIFHV